MVRLTHNVSKFNSHVITTTQKIENWLTKLKNFIAKFKTNKQRPTKTVRHKLERTTTHIYVKAMQIFVMTTVFNAEATSSAYNARTDQQWDSDSVMIGIDNRLSACISYGPADFVGDLQEFTRTIKGFG